MQVMSNRHLSMQEPGGISLYLVLSSWLEDDIFHNFINNYPRRNSIVGVDIHKGLKIHTDLYLYKDLNLEFNLLWLAEIVVVLTALLHAHSSRLLCPLFLFLPLTALLPSESLPLLAPLLSPPCPLNLCSCFLCFWLHLISIYTSNHKSSNHPPPSLFLCM